MKTKMMQSTVGWFWPSWRVCVTARTLRSQLRPTRSTSPGSVRSSSSARRVRRGRTDNNFRSSLDAAAANKETRAKLDGDDEKESRQQETHRRHSNQRAVVVVIFSRINPAIMNGGVLYFSTHLKDANQIIKGK